MRFEVQKPREYQKQSALTERMPELRSIPRIDLASTPTPFVQHQELGRRIGYPDLWIKQDNLSSPVYGGNKPRKLEFALAQVLHRGCRSVVTIGGIGTNHGLATAIFSQRLSLDCHLVLFEQPVTQHVQTSLRLMHRFGATLHFAANHPAISWRVARLLAPTKLGRTEEPMAFIPGGGTSPVNILGFVDAAFELQGQIEKSGIRPPSALFCPLGTGGTLAGLVLGFKLCDLPTRVIGVRVVDRVMANAYRVAFLANRSLRLIKRYCRRVALPAIRPRDVSIMEGYFAGGYGTVSREAEDALALAGDHGVTLETTYTAKAFAAVIDYVKKLSPREGPVLFWNTFNSVDHSAQAAAVDYRELPRPFHRFFSKSAQTEETVRTRTSAC
ncbi:MAG: pyridoxal-phosphate dependent enzyme [Deltaproteobacteria bacterium]|nr:pyridoxal-phosphate dependent enzyme [Deltaproteobacteria bacterium]